MTEREKKVVLLDYRGGVPGATYCFHVYRVYNSTELLVHGHLTREQVNQLIKEGWEVEIRQPR